MTLSLKVSLYLAVVTGILTLLVGAVSTVAPTVVIYRTLVSVVLFAALGYISGQLAERYLRGKLDETGRRKGEHLDVVSLDEGGDGLLSPSGFQPLAADDFENIIIPQKEDGGVSAHGS